MAAGDNLHVETVVVGRADYGRAYRLMFREALRSDFIRRRVFRNAFLTGFLSVLAGCSVFIGYECVRALLRGRSAWPQLEHHAWWLPAYLAAAIAFALILIAWRIGALARMLRRVRRLAEREIGDRHELSLAWNDQRFGVIVEGRLHVWDIRDLQSGDGCATHLFAVIPDGGNLIPIPLAQVDAAAADRLRRGMAESGVPALWTRLEREMLLTAKELQAPGVDEVFS
jgi:hypothetical protein